MPCHAPVSFAQSVRVFSKLFGASIEILLEKLQISKRLIGTWFDGDPPVEFRHCLGNFAFIAEHGRELKQT
jgi:hypothetical protein